MNKNTGYGFWGLKGSLSIIMVIACAALILPHLSILDRKTMTRACMMDIERRVFMFNRRIIVCQQASPN